MAVLPPRELVALARAQGRDTDLPAIAVSVSLVEGYDINDPATLLEPSILLTPCPHPVLAALLDTSGATRRGRMSWVVGMGDDYTPRPMNVLRDHVAPGIVMHERSAATARGGPKDLHEVNAWNKFQVLGNHLSGSPAGIYQDQGWRTAVSADYPAKGAASFGAITISGDHRVLWIKAVTHQLEVPAELGNVSLNLRPAGRPFKEPQPVHAWQAVGILDMLSREGITIVDPSEDDVVATLRAKVATSVIAIPCPGRPALAQTSIGRLMFRIHDLAEFTAPDAFSSAANEVLTAEQVADLCLIVDNDNCVIHAGVSDVAAMTQAELFNDPLLRDYQREAVGLHVSTDIGYLQTCSPGMGKTVIQLRAMQARALDRPRYRGLVLAEAQLRTQWVDEAAIWFPEARVIKVESRHDWQKMHAGLTECEGPLLVVISYHLLTAISAEILARHTPITPESMWEILQDTDEDQLALFSPILDQPADQPAVAPNADGDDSNVSNVNLGSLLLDTYWHDIAADEAEVLRGTGTKQLDAMWQLRACGEVAVALTGTPINRSVDDLGRLISWVRNDRHLFHGVRLSTQFDLATDEGIAGFLAAVGPIVFRRDSSEIADELPTIKPTVMRLQPSVAEKALASAARSELKRVYTELLAWLDMVEQTDPDNPSYAQARDGLKAARGAWLGGTTLARMASSDPAALLGSASAGAALLAGGGLIEAATSQPGTKRTAVISDCLSRISRGQRPLIFTEFATVARGLIQDLDDGGARVGSVMGDTPIRTRDAMVAAFQRGELDVLVCTAAGERGLNLQNATTIYHYDLPWTPKGVIQRTGRARRIKSANTVLEVIFPLMEGTIEERVAALVVSRAVEAMRALDGSRGIDVADTEMGLALGGLVLALDDIAAGGVAHGGPAQSALMQMTHALVN